MDDENIITALNKTSCLIFTPN